ncbi:hypothetical protein EHI8A_113670 [Entamoeba histolytica HM-1:IMSS-B]|uniref:Uncharacterized protein n=6 Tax=Entamoeba histolytica TaxID=5759 RepID=C4LX48_ENTH1|nr:hypothetical protein EHI_159680 [Entamoeba histolytica HM-1:IMSS]EMD42368.1 Hypothetical protein EHI5A_154310 [Entamoeba histolytica KU27]EMH74464.1 hypothetical protein EHI8A_113670 [Entamoeba histolytica HM-1:IMSS-B]EMS13938.1 hypothetical protein KM1_187290 [Entamoeba histolytica HM-3:IMSS]ENY63529.1 hypothetical protein EHI7A_108500 [Entamoeba histolytica HM-1:IMSS-A]GAT93303.1 hypothetical protein CL6EHI_159680 [Entamoeba histolytica]|eukprot:XP_650246.1 hypothetical protein EHI_159680 [Entamoeba histolytica HM-1:IMSS]
MKRRHLVPMIDEENMNEFIQEIKQQPKRKGLRKDENGIWRRRSLSNERNSPNKENKKVIETKPIKSINKSIKNNKTILSFHQTKFDNEQKRKKEKSMKDEEKVINEDNELSDSLIQFLDQIEANDNQENMKEQINQPNLSSTTEHSLSILPHLSIKESQQGVEEKKNNNKNIQQKKEEPVVINLVESPSKEDSSDNEWSLPAFLPKRIRSISKEEVIKLDKNIYRNNDEYYGESSHSIYVASQAGCIDNVSDDEDEFKQDEVTPSQQEFINDELPTQRFEPAFYAASLSSQCPQGFSTSKRERMIKKLYGKTTRFSFH